MIARIGSGAQLRTKTARFPLLDSDGIPYSKKNAAELLRCRLQLLEDVRTERALETASGDSLAAAIDQWLITHPRRPGSRDHEDYHLELPHWRRLPWAGLSVRAVTRKLIAEALDQWEEAGRAPSTLNHRRRVLHDVLADALGAADDDDVIVPTSRIARRREKPLQPRGIPMPIIARILAAMPDYGRAAKGEDRPPVSHSKIRAHVMAWTGLAHQSLKRLQRRDVNFKEGKLFLPARRKGAGAAGVWVSLLPPALEALRQYDAAKLWGRAFSSASLHASFRRAVQATRAALTREAEASGDQTLLEQFLTSVPANAHPYDLRHSFLTDAYRQSGDVLAVKELAQHADISTTERYTKGAVSERAADAIDRMRAKWFPDAKKPAGVVRDFQIVSSQPRIP